MIPFTLQSAHSLLTPTATALAQLCISSHLGYPQQPQLCIYYTALGMMSYLCMHDTMFYKLPVSRCHVLDYFFCKHIINWHISDS